MLEDRFEGGVLPFLRRGVLDHLRRGVLDFLRQGVLHPSYIRLTSVLHPSYIRLTSVLHASYIRLTCVLDFLRRGILQQLWMSGTGPLSPRPTHSAHQLWCIARIGMQWTVEMSKRFRF